MSDNASKNDGYNPNDRPCNAKCNSTQKEMVTMWTNERPTEAGEYWCSLRPNERERLVATQPVLCVVVSWNKYGRFWVVRWFDADRQECSLSMDDSEFDGAKWSRRESPGDPFKEG